MDTITKLIAVLIGSLGVWLMAFSFAAGSPPVDTVNDLVVGGVVAIAAGYNYTRTDKRGGPSRRVSGIVVLLGTWLLFAPFLIDLEGLPLWNDVAIGVLLAAFGGYEGYVAPVGGQSASRHSTDGT